MSVAWTDRERSQPAVRSARSEPAVPYSDATEAFSDELCRHPSVLGRLVTIASCYDENSGRYSHKLSERFGAHEADRALARLHQEIFVTWLSLPLRQQEADVAIYMAGLGIKPEWFDFGKMGRSCLPKTATLPERDLFLLDLELIQALRRY
jgi:hypothetical protein